MPQAIPVDIQSEPREAKSAAPNDHQASGSNLPGPAAMPSAPPGLNPSSTTLGSPKVTGNIGSIAKKEASQPIKLASMREIQLSQAVATV